MTAPTDLVTMTASTLNPGRLVLTQKDASRPLHVRVIHPGVAEYQLASGAPSATGDMGWYLDGKTGRETLFLELGGDARYQISVREAGVRGAAWLLLEGWQDLVGATRMTGNPAVARLY